MTDASQPSDLNTTTRDSALSDAMWRGNGGWELAVSPVLVGGLGWLLDTSVGTLPIFTVLGAIVGLFGAVANQYYRYSGRMAVATAERAAQRESQSVAENRTRFSAVYVEELPSYVVESDLRTAAEDANV